jgi:hypothetical protein
VCVCARASACSLSYPACNAHAPCYIVICTLPARLYNIFPRYPINCTIFGKYIIEYEVCVLIFFTNFVPVANSGVLCNLPTYLENHRLQYRVIWCDRCR